MPRAPHEGQQPEVSYRSRLRDIGLHLDAHGFHALAIIEAQDGLLVRASRAGSRAPELIEVANGDGRSVDAHLPSQHAVPRKLFPQGYAPFLEALGARLDVSGAAAISIVEATDFVVVGGIQLVNDGPDGRAYEPLDLLLLPNDIRALLATPLAREVVRPNEPARAPAEQPTSEAPHAAGLGDVFHRLTAPLRSPVLRLRD